MSLEVECKYLEVDLAALRANLKKLSAKFKGLVFEENLVFDSLDHKLKNSRTLLRLRTLYSATGISYLVTLKLPKENSATCKIREEREVRVLDGPAFESILAGLGYGVAFRYEKKRESWQLESVEIDLDTLPFGDFVELEGSEEAILKLAKPLGLDNNPTSTQCYHDLNFAYQKKRGLDLDPNFVFEPLRRAELLAQVGFKA
ncbi:MAG: class IV adenylate cyclase [Desulfovibrionaceae bacterium]|nr:class IV adenylate cyclase [Desulfovibrionaceae bacterium]